MNPLELLTGYQGSAVVAAACRSGVADEIARQPRQPAVVAAACGTDPRATRALLGALAALGLADRRDDGYLLSADGAVLASDHPETVALIVEKEWYFYRVWQGLPESVRDGHARIPPWRERLERDPARSFAFLRALDDLAARFGGELPGLAGLDRPGRLLDVGGGAGSHAARLARALPGLEATVLDLAPVEPVLRERHPELAFVAGDLDQPRFGRPAGERWDAVLVANVLHDHPAPRCERIVREAAGLLAPGGTLLVYEWVLDDDGDAPGAVALFDLMMLVENEGGAAWTESELAGWLRAAGLTGVETRRGAGPIGVVRGHAPVPTSE